MRTPGFLPGTFLSPATRGLIPGSGVYQPTGPSATKDATSDRFVPQSAAEWTSLLSGSGIASPDLLWLCQESSGNLADSIGSYTGTTTGSPTYRNSVTGWSAKSVICRDGQSDLIQNA